MRNGPDQPGNETQFLFIEFCQSMAGLQKEVFNRFPSEWSSIFSAHFLRTRQLTTSGSLQSEALDRLMRDQYTAIPVTYRFEKSFLIQGER